MDVTSSGSRRRPSTSMPSSRSCLSSPSHKTWMTNLWNIPYRGICKKPQQELFRRVIEAFTPRRVMWGSNFPSSRAGGYLGQVRLGQTALPWLSDDDRRWIMGETAHTLWPMLQGPVRG